MTIDEIKKSAIEEAARAIYEDVWEGNIPMGTCQEYAEVAIEAYEKAMWRPIKEGYPKDGFTAIIGANYKTQGLLRYRAIFVMPSGAGYVENTCACGKSYLDETKEFITTHFRLFPAPPEEVI